MNIATVIVIFGIAAAVLGALVSLRKRKATGSSRCSCGCENCAMNGLCHK